MIQDENLYDNEISYYNVNDIYVPEFNYISYDNISFDGTGCSIVEIDVSVVYSCLIETCGKKYIKVRLDRCFSELQNGKSRYPDLSCYCSSDICSLKFDNGRHHFISLICVYPYLTRIKCSLFFAGEIDESLATMEKNTER